ncbi:MAG: protein YgfX [Gammaproteobacteria bacterium]
MSSPPFDGTIELAPRPSIRALTLLFWLHAGVLGLVALALGPSPGMAAVAVLVALSWILTRRHSTFGFGPNALARLTWHAEGSWTVHDTRGARWDGVTLHGSSLVHDHLLMLVFRLPDGETRVRALLGDELDEGPQRRLRARLLLLRASRAA